MFLQVRIPREFRAQLADVRILKRLAGAKGKQWASRAALGWEPRGEHGSGKEKERKRRTPRAARGKRRRKEHRGGAETMGSSEGDSVLRSQEIVAGMVTSYQYTFFMYCLVIRMRRAGSNEGCGSCANGRRWLGGWSFDAGVEMCGKVDFHRRVTLNH